jgi:outer membrane cobalamin receptor
MKLFASFFLMIFLFQGLAQDKFTISGSVKDNTNGEDLIGVNVLVKEIPGSGAATNVYGYYSLSVPAGSYTLIYKYVGYTTIEENIEITENIVKNVELIPESAQLKEFNVNAQKDDENIKSNEISTIKFDPKDIETIPVIFGEKDILKTITLLPGVKTAGEGNSGFFVRGGGADQNLILLDGAPVYNASHLLGFFSVFNSDALKDINLIKGGMPAEYGGRVSSVMDIKMKEGNSKGLSVSGGIGTISSKLTVEAPIKKDKGSFIISGRRTYADVFLNFAPDTNLRGNTLYFYDLNAKANYTLSDKDRVFISGYFGRDKFGFGDSFGFDWGNATGTLRWNHIYNSKLFSNTSVMYSNYDYRINIGAAGFSFGSTIQDWNVKQDFQWFANDKHNVKFGLNAIYHNFSPGEVEVQEGSPLLASEVQKSLGVEGALYVSDEFKVSPVFNVVYGLRYSTYAALGNGNIFSYDDEGNLVDTTLYERGEVSKWYHGIEPRLAMNYILNDVSSVKASYARNNQYVHLLSNSTTGSPTDIWLPSSNNIKPQISDQVTLGYFRNFNKNMFEFSLEGYYKTLDNLIDYRTGAELNFNATVEGDLVYGKGRAYGAELLIRKKKGDFTGWVGYTLSRSLRQFSEINNGEWFSARQDRIHDVSVVLMYSFSERVKGSASWVYYTGDAVTFPSGKYQMDGVIYNYFTERNGYRMPNYHRMDVGVTLYGKEFKLVKDPISGEEVQKKKKFQSNWNFSVYNAYARENAFSISFRQNEDNPEQSEAVQLSLFKIIPSITYSFKF